MRSGTVVKPWDATRRSHPGKKEVIVLCEIELIYKAFVLPLFKSSYKIANSTASSNLSIMPISLPRT